MKKALHDTFHRGFPREVKVKIVKLSFDYMDVLLAVVGSYTYTSDNVIFLMLAETGGFCTYTPPRDVKVKRKVCLLSPICYTPGLSICLRFKF